MIKKYLLLVGVIVGMHLQNIADGNAYETLCTNEGLSSFENECCRALADPSILTCTEFTNRLVEIAGAMTNHEIRVDAMLVLALRPD